jgi:hypothetical protein
VDPLFWQTWWFGVSVVAVLLLAGLALYRFRLHQLARRLNLRFEERLAERTRIAQELHDTLLQGFLSASMQVHVMADRLPADSPAKPNLKRALELMAQVIEEGRNAVRGLRSSHGASFDLEHAFAQIPAEFAAQESTLKSGSGLSCKAADDRCALCSGMRYIVLAGKPSSTRSAMRGRATSKSRLSIPRGTYYSSYVTMAVESILKC